MYAILRTWYLSLDLLHPFKFLNFTKSVLRVYARALGQFITNFGWLIGIDALATLLPSLRESSGAASSPGGLNSSLAIIMLVQAVIWFLASSALFLLIRKEDTIHPKAYFRIYFFRYMQILFAFSFLFLLCIYFLLMAGITKLPNAPWIALMIAKTAELYIVFYWLDAKGYFVDIVHSCEKAINLLFYNAPILAVFLAFLWVSDYSLCLLVGAVTGKTQAHLLFFNTSVYPSQTATLAMLSKALAIKYLAFFVEYFWLCVVFVFYRRKKHEQYATSIFQKA